MSKKPTGKRIDNIYTDSKGNVFDDTGHFQGRWIPAEHSAFVDKVLAAEKKDGVWYAIDEMVKYWKKANPQEWESMLVDISELRQTRASSTGASKHKHTRYLADIPVKLWNMILAFYKDKKLIDPYSKEFFQEFSKKFPEFRVAEKI